jgi:AcrR family transcriptional regulator
MDVVTASEPGADVGSDPDVQSAIREATYRALCRHGYHETTIQHIADEFEKSKSLLYYHYEDKHELLTDFLRHLLDELAERLTVDGEDPYDDLLTLVDRIVPVPMDDDEAQFRRILLEIRAAAPHDASHRELVRRSDTIIRSAFADVIRRGVEEGRFDSAVDPDEAAEFVHTTLLGTMIRGVSLDDPETVARTRETLVTYLDRYLLVA